MNKKGISVVALVITIIVLIILTSTAILNITGDNNVINKASDAVVANNNAVLEEKIIMKSNDYMLKGKDSFTSETRETLKQIVNESKIDLDKLLVYYGSDNQYVCYKIDKVTKEETEWFWKNLINVNGTEKDITCLFGDANLDGEINKDDVAKVNNISNGSSTRNELDSIMLDLSFDGLIHSDDLIIINDIINSGNYSTIIENYKNNKNRIAENMKNYFGIEFK